MDMSIEKAQLGTLIQKNLNCMSQETYNTLNC